MAVAARLGALSYGEAWRGKAVGARCVSVLLVLVSFVQGGQGVLCSGMASYGEAWRVRRSRRVTLWLAGSG